jgi:hypothetical protein
VTEAIVDDAPLAALAGTDDGEVAILAPEALAGEVDLGRVEAEQDADSVSREVLQLVDLVPEGERAGEVSHTWKFGGLDKQRGVELAPGVAVEIAAEHRTRANEGTAQIAAKISIKTLCGVGAYGQSSCLLVVWRPSGRARKTNVIFNGYRLGKDLIFLADMCPENLSNRLFFDSWDLPRPGITAGTESDGWLGKVQGDAP